MMRRRALLGAAALLGAGVRSSSQFTPVWQRQLASARRQAAAAPLARNSGAS